MYRSSPGRSTLNTGYISNNSVGRKGRLEASLRGEVTLKGAKGHLKGGLKGGYLKVTIRGRVFRVTLRGGGLKRGYLNGRLPGTQRGALGGVS